MLLRMHCYVYSNSFEIYVYETRLFTTEGPDNVYGGVELDFPLENMNVALVT